MNEYQPIKIEWIKKKAKKEQAPREMFISKMSFGQEDMYKQGYVFVKRSQLASRIPAVGDFLQPEIRGSVKRKIRAVITPRSLVGIEREIVKLGESGKTVDRKAIELVTDRDQESKLVLILFDEQE